MLKSFQYSLFGFLLILPVFLFSQKVSSENPVIDTHEHIQNISKAEDLSQAMENRKIDQTVLIPSPIETLTMNGRSTFTGFRENNEEMLKIAAAYPGKFIPFCTASSKEDDALEVLKSCHERGGKGLKLYNGHSFFYPFFETPLDSPRLKPLYAYAEKVRLPVLYHVNISEYGEELEKVLTQYPNLIVSVPHFMVSSLDLSRVKEYLDHFPNLYTDISFGHTPYFSAGFRRISQNSELFKEFFNQYPDRILFGADMVLTDMKQKDRKYMEEILQCYRDILEKETFRCAPVQRYYRKEMLKARNAYKKCQAKAGAVCDSKKEKMDSFSRWTKEVKTLKGLNLSGEILNKIYRENPARFLSGGSE